MGIETTDYNTDNLKILTTSVIDENINDLLNKVSTNESNELTPEKIDRFKEEYISFINDMKLTIIGTSYLNSCYVAIENDYNNREYLTQQVMGIKTKAIGYLQNAFSNVGNQEIGGDINPLSDPTLFFAEKRKTLRFDELTSRLKSINPSKEAFLQGSGAGLGLRISGFLTKIYDANTKKKDDVYYKNKENELNQIIYTNMGGFLQNLLGPGARLSRSYAAEFEENLFQKMIYDKEILDQIKIPGLFYYFLPIKEVDMPKINFSDNNGDMQSVSFQFMTINGQNLIKCQRNIWTNNITKEVIYIKPDDEANFDIGHGECVYEKTGPNTYKPLKSVSKSGQMIFEKPDEIGLPDVLVFENGDNAESCTIECTDKTGESVYLQLIEEGIFVANPLDELNSLSNENDRDLAREIVEVGASSIYFELIRNLLEGKVMMMGLTTPREFDSFDDINTFILTIGSNSMDNYIHSEILRICKERKIQRPAHLELPSFKEAYTAALDKIRYNPEMLNIARIFGDKELLEKNAKQQLLIIKAEEYLKNKAYGFGPRTDNLKYHTIYEQYLLAKKNGLLLIVDGKISFTKFLSTENRHLFFSATLNGNNIEISASENRMVSNDDETDNENDNIINIQDTISLDQVEINKAKSKIDKSNAQIYAQMLGKKMFREGLEFFSLQVNGKTNEYANIPNSSTNPVPLIDRYRDTNPYRETYTELVGTGNWNMDVFEFGNTIDTAKTFAEDIAVIAISGGIAGELSLLAIRAYRASRLISAARGVGVALNTTKELIAADRVLQLCHTTLTGIAFHPISTTLSSLIKGKEFDDTYWESMTNGYDYLHSILTMHLLGYIGKEVSNLGNIAPEVEYSIATGLRIHKPVLSKALSNGIYTLGIGAEVGALLGLHAGFNLVFPDKLSGANASDVAFGENLLHTLATVIALRLVHLPLKPGVKGVDIKTIEIKDTENLHATITLKNGAIFEIIDGKFTAKNDKAIELLTDKDAVDIETSIRNNPEISVAKSLFEHHNNTHRNEVRENMDLNDFARIEEAVTLIEETTGLILNESQKAAFGRNLLEAHNESETTGGYYNRNLQIPELTLSCLIKKIRLLHEGLKGIEIDTQTKNEIIRGLIEKGLAGKKEAKVDITISAEEVRNIIRENLRKMNLQFINDSNSIFGIEPKIKANDRIKTREDVNKVVNDFFAEEKKLLESKGVGEDVIQQLENIIQDINNGTVFIPYQELLTTLQNNQVSLSTIIGDEPFVVMYDTPKGARDLGSRTLYSDRVCSATGKKPLRALNNSNFSSNPAEIVKSIETSGVKNILIVDDAVYSGQQICDTVSLIFEMYRNNPTSNPPNILINSGIYGKEFLQKIKKLVINSGRLMPEVLLAQKDGKPAIKVRDLNIETNDNMRIIENVTATQVLEYNTLIRAAIEAGRKAGAIRSYKKYYRLPNGWKFSNLKTNQQFRVQIDNIALKAKIEKGEKTLEQYISEIAASKSMSVEEFIDLQLSESYMEYNLFLRPGQIPLILESKIANKVSIPPLMFDAMKANSTIPTTDPFYVGLFSGLGIEHANTLLSSEVDGKWVPTE